MDFIDERWKLKSQTGDDSKRRYKQLNNHIRREALRVK